MDKSISFFDGGAEGFYHGLMLGLIALMDNQYKIKSNRESGDGRFDVSLIPREKRYPGIILELKWKEKLSDVELEKWSNEALKQIGELRYDLYSLVLFLYVIYFLTWHTFSFLFLPFQASPFLSVHLPT